MPAAATTRPLVARTSCAGSTRTRCAECRRRPGPRRARAGRGRSACRPRPRGRAAGRRQSRSRVCSARGEGAGQTGPHGAPVSLRERPELPLDDRLIEGEQLHTDPALRRQARLAPVAERHVARPVAPSRRGDHREDHLAVRIVEPGRRDDQGRPALRGAPIGKRKRHHDDRERLKGYATRPRPRTSSIRRASPGPLPATRRRRRSCA